jgi:hypothetical protein
MEAAVEPKLRTVLAAPVTREENFAPAGDCDCVCRWPKAGQQVRCKMALVSLVAVARMLAAWAVGTITSPASRRRACSRTWPITGSVAPAPVPITSRRHRQGMSSAAGSGVWPYARRNWREAPLLRLRISRGR